MIDNFTTTARYTSKISGCSASLHEYDYNGRRVYGASLRRNKRAKKSDYVSHVETVAERNEIVKQYMAQQDAAWITAEDAKRERNEERKAERETVEERYKVGDAIYNSWGYEQTNVEFYQIVRRSKTYVWLQPMTSEMVTAGPNYTGTVRPGELITDAQIEKHKINVWNGQEQSIHFRFGGGYLYEKPVGFTAYY